MAAPKQRIERAQAQSEDYYSTLGVSHNATLSGITKAYKALALRWHPDKNEDNKEEAERVFRKISEAYNVLSNESSRARYDRQLLENAIQAVPPTPSSSVRAYCFIVPTSRPRQSSSAASRPSCSYTTESSLLATLPQPSLTSVHGSSRPVVTYDMSRPSTSQQTPPIVTYDMSRPSTSQQTPPIVTYDMSQPSTSQQTPPIVTYGMSRPSTSRQTPPIVTYDMSRPSTSQQTPPIVTYGMSQPSTSQQTPPPVVTYDMYQPSTSTHHYSFSAPMTSYLPKQAMSTSGYGPSTSSAATPYYQTPPTNTNDSLSPLTADFERQTSTRFIGGNRIDIEIIRDGDTELVNVFYNRVLTKSTFRRRRPPSS